MTREEAVLILKTFMDNPLFNDAHKSAFNIAIHDIEVYQKWNLNELVLTQKDNEQEPILDKIRAEIRANSFYVMPQYGRIIREADVLQIIDKYKAETEADNGNDD